MSDSTNPQIVILQPTPLSKNNLRDSKIAIKLVDSSETGSGIDTTSLLAVINGQYAIKNGEYQAGFDGYIQQDPDLNQIYVEIQRTQIFNYLESVNIAISVRDLNKNPAATSTFSFITEDNAAPQIINLVPLDRAGQIGTNQTISFTITTSPYETSVNINSLIVGIRGIEVDSSGTPILDGYGNPIETIFIQPDNLGQVAYDRRTTSITPTLDGLGYDVNIVPLNPLPLASQIIIRIQVEDQAKNIANSLTSFSTLDNSPPFLLNPLPIPDSTANSLIAPISFSLGDKQGSFSGSGINLNSLQISINNQKVVIDSIPQDSYELFVETNDDINGYDIILVSSILWPPKKTINITITASDYNLNILNTNFSFTTQQVEKPQIFPRFPIPNSTGVLSNSPIIIDFKSTVAIQELNINSIKVSINGISTFEDNAFNPNYTGTLSVTTSKVLTLSIQPNQPFSLGETINVTCYIEDIFNNPANIEYSYLITTQTSLHSQISPIPGIYNTASSSSSQFPTVGAYLDITLSCNQIQGTIAYTLDGSEPLIDGYFNTIGTTQIYNSPLRLRTSELGVVRFFAFNSLTNEQETIKNNAIYFFTNCPEQDMWSGNSLSQGLEYTIDTNLNEIVFKNNKLTTAINSKIGNFIYQYDLGRLSFVNSLDFLKTGILKFRVKLADTYDQLKTVEWSNTLSNLLQNNYLQIISNDNGLNFSSEENLLTIEGNVKNYSSSFFNNEVLATVQQPLLPSFVVNADMKISSSLSLANGAKSFIRLQDDTYKIDIQQIFSQVNVDLSVGSNVFKNQQVQTSADNIPFYIEGYGMLVDDDLGHLEASYPSEIEIETPTIIKSTSLKFNQQTDLPTDTSKILEVVHSTQAVYNTFPYSSSNQGIKYSSAEYPSIFYKILSTDRGDNFVIPVVGKSLDINICSIISENFNTIINEFIPAETNDIFKISKFYEAGDYLYRYRISYTRNQQQLTRLVSNPYLFKTKRDLSIVQTGDILVVNSQQFLLESFTKLNTGEYIIEFFDNFPLTTTTIVEWKIIRNTATIISNADPKTAILVDNYNQAILTLDAQGVVSNIIIPSRGSRQFIYASSTATSVELLDSIPSTSLLIRDFDPSSIASMFDGSLSTNYQNNWADFNKVTVTTSLPIIVDKIRFKTATSSSAKQRVRLLLDENFVEKTTYLAKDGYNNEARYETSENVPATIKIITKDIGSSSSNTKQLLLISPQPTSGKFKLKFKNQVTDYISYNVTASSLQNALANLSLLQNNIRVHGNLSSGFVIEFIENLQLQSQPLLEVEQNMLNGIFNTSSSTDIYASSNDLYIEWKYNSSADNLNTKHYNSISLLSRLENPSTENTRKHTELEIFSLPEMPTFASDFIKPVGELKLIRKNKSELTKEANFTNIKYAAETALNFIPTSVENFFSFDVVGNILYSNILGVLEDNYLYLDKSFLFSKDEEVVIYDGINLVPITINSISSDGSGGIELRDPISPSLISTINSTNSVKIFKNYKIKQDENSFQIQIEVPKYNTAFLGAIISNSVGTGFTELIFENSLGLDPSLLINGRFFYPLLSNFAQVIKTNSFQQVVDSNIKNLFTLTIDKELLYISPTVGACIETYNTTEVVTDYTILKVDGSIICLNQSGLCKTNPQITYKHRVDEYLAPKGALEFEQDPTKLVKIEITAPSNLALTDVDKFFVNIFNGVEAQSPQQITFVVNQAYTKTITINEASIIDGYSEHLYTPTNSETNQLLQFAITPQQLLQIGSLDGYSNVILESLAVEFTGLGKYQIAEIGAFIINQQFKAKCQVVINQELAAQATTTIPLNEYAQYSIHVDKGSLLIFLNNDLVYQRPIILNSPKIIFGASGKVAGDYIKVNFKNLYINQYFDSSPALIQQTGRYLEIEGTIISL